MQTLDDMLSLHLLSPAQHAEIRDWAMRERTPEGIQAMPPHLWRALELASVLMGFDTPPATGP